MSTAREERLKIAAEWVNRCRAPKQHQRDGNESCLGQQTTPRSGSCRLITTKTIEFVRKGGISPKGEDMAASALRNVATRADIADHHPGSKRC